VGTPGQLRAWFLIADFAESEDETVNDIIFIETVGNILTMSLQNIRLFEEKLSAERLRREIELAGDIQNQALPKNFDLHPALDIHAHSVPHSNVAGDFYNLIPMGESEIVVFMADAAGKGIAAAILITNIQATLNALLLDGASFSTVLRRLHQVIGRLTHYEKFVTLFLGKIDLARGQLTYVNAGHNPPLLLRANRQREWLRKGCIPLGIMEVKQFEQGTVAFCPGDLLYLYSDGLVEQPAPSGEMFGEERLERLMLSSSHQNANKLLNATLRAIAAHAAGNDYEDDISLMAIRYVNAV